MSGLGLAAARHIAGEGALIALVDLKEEALEEATDKLRGAAEAITDTADVFDPKQVAAYVKKTVETVGRIDGFFNNAGIEHGRVGIQISLGDGRV